MNTFELIIAIITALYLLGHLVYWNRKLGVENFLDLEHLKKEISSLYTKNQRRIYVAIYFLLMIACAWFSPEPIFKLLFVILGIFPMITVYALFFTAFTLALLTSLLVELFIKICKGIIFLFNLPKPKWLEEDN